MEVKAQLYNAFAQNRKALLLAGVGVAAVGLGLGYKYLRQKPETLVRVGVVSQLLVHPLKSGRAVSVALAECQKKGLKFGELQDRHWMVTMDDGHMVTGRQQPRLVLVSLTCEGSQVCLNGPNMEQLMFPLKQPDNRVVSCRVFGTDIHGLDCGDEASEWLTRYLGGNKTFRLVHHEPEMKGRRPPEGPFPDDEVVAYSDVAPVMLLSEASVQDLSSKLDNGVKVNRFRPNIVVSDCEAFAEDSWKELQIGSVRLQRVMSCGRCIFTTVDPETGITSRKEPLQTLKSYRQCVPSEKQLYKSDPLFGQLLTVERTGILQVGDVVYHISR
ncbi:mitochondrial amidoxime-reducing component 1 [Cynoglossus semilaevis]|uniref:mitochondrial amidoxime-reducing component 1 n=1 Tax=Cynoglossus semilaevis TaxID=244447 RepID=UPI0004962091|nr:mitochondrial amidoxime-reducing component 1-like [Cynoglossus semilaevis]